MIVRRGNRQYLLFFITFYNSFYRKTYRKSSYPLQSKHNVPQIFSPDKQKYLGLAKKPSEIMDESLGINI